MTALDPITLVIGVAVMAVISHYAYPTLEHWQARRAAEKRLKEATNR